MGTRLPPSKSLSVLWLILACFASSSCDQPSHPRAALHCSGDNMSRIFSGSPDSVNLGRNSLGSDGLQA